MLVSFQTLTWGSTSAFTVSRQREEEKVTNKTTCSRCLTAATRTLGNTTRSWKTEGSLKWRHAGRLMVLANAKVVCAWGADTHNSEKKGTKPSEVSHLRCVSESARGQTPIQLQASAAVCFRNTLFPYWIPELQGSLWQGVVVSFFILFPVTAEKLQVFFLVSGWLDAVLALQS